MASASAFPSATWERGEFSRNDPTNATNVQVTFCRCARCVVSLLFATDRPLTPKAVAHALQQAIKFSPSPEPAAFEKTSLTEIESAVEQLNAKLQADGSSLMVQGIAGGYQLKTRPEFAV